MPDEKEYFVIKIYDYIPDEHHVGYLRTIDKITDKYVDNDGKEISADYIDVIATNVLNRSKIFDTVTEAKEWLRKITSTDCHYKKYNQEFKFDIVFCRKDKEVVVWENSKQD